MENEISRLLATLNTVVAEFNDLSLFDVRYAKYFLFDDRKELIYRLVLLHKIKIR